MFAQERRKQIIAYLKEKKRVEIRELEELFQVTGATIRTDLRELEKTGALVRTHGGAMWKDSGFQPEEQPMYRTASDQKQRIAREAVKYINPGDTIILDSGSTILELARQMKDMRDIKVITNDLQIALELQENPWIDLYLVGGRVRNRFCMTHGAIAIDFLKGIAVNKVFLSPNALSLEDEATTSNEEMKVLKQEMLKISGEAYLLCDSSKIGRRSFCQFAKISDFHQMITDDGIRAEDQKAIESQGLNVIVC